MVNKKTKKVEKKSVGSAASSPKKTIAKTVSRKKSTKQKKDSSVKKVTVSNKPVAKKDTKKPVKTKKATVKKTTTKVTEKKKTVKKKNGRVVANGKAELRIKKASKSELKKVGNVIDNLSKTSNQTKLAPAPSVTTEPANEKKKTKGFVTTVPGVFRRVPAGQKTKPSSHKTAPIQGIINYLKNIF